MASVDGLLEKFSFETVQQRSVQGNLLYYEIYMWKMKNAPKDIDQFCDPRVGKNRREKLIKWIRDIDDRTSCQSLQILFSFSIPCPSALERILCLNVPIVSAGAGTGYWEMLLEQRGADVVGFDSNEIYPENMRYIQVMTGGPSLLANYPDRALMVSWPDSDETVLDHCLKCLPSEGSTFSADCLNHYKGNTVIHIGEMFGETFSTNPWGQTTSQDFQLCLIETFRCVSRVQLPNWPGHMDSLTIWSRATSVSECDSMQMVNLLTSNPRYYGWQADI